MPQDAAEVALASLAAILISVRFLLSNMGYMMGQPVCWSPSQGEEGRKKCAFGSFFCSSLSAVVLDNFLQEEVQKGLVSFLI